MNYLTKSNFVGMYKSFIFPFTIWSRPAGEQLGRDSFGWIFPGNAAEGCMAAAVGVCCSCCITHCSHPSYIIYDLALSNNQYLGIACVIHPYIQTIQIRIAKWWLLEVRHTVLLCSLQHLQHCSIKWFMVFFYHRNKTPDSLQTFFC